MIKRFFFILAAIAVSIATMAAQTTDFDRSKPVVIALTERISSLDTLGNSVSDSGAERVRALIYNSLISKNENFEYVGELGEYRVGIDNSTVVFTLRDNIKFHNGKVLSSADVKYTFDALFAGNGAKAGSFYDSVPDKERRGATKKVPHIKSIETPDSKTVVFKVARIGLVNQLLSNLATIPIIPEGTIEEQSSMPIGTGAFKLVSFDQSEGRVKLEGFQDYWEGAPKIAKLNVKTVPDANALLSELLRGTVDIALNPAILSPDALDVINKSGSLKVERFPGSNIQYIGFNTRVSPFNNFKVRQAIAYAIDRQKIIGEIFEGRAKIAHSILPEESWAYTTGTRYDYQPKKAKQLLREAGYKGQVVKFKYMSGNEVLSRYVQVVQTMLKNVGFNVEIEALEPQTLIETLKNGQFQMSTGIWVGGNQDPLFYRDLFASSNSPERTIYGRNRARYSDPEFDKIINEAARTTDRTKARELYARAQELVSRDVPLLPLWYPASIVVANKRIKNLENIKSVADLLFLKRLETAE